MRIARVFPRRTTATPDDPLAFVGEPGLFPPQVDEVHVSVTFTWDIPEAERLAKAWAPVAPVRVGGPAMGDRGSWFVPGQYLRRGYTITSRGCPNSCWFCDVPRREGPIRELSIAPGWNVLDSNLLACSAQHIRDVFSMLSEQSHRPVFSGGLEAARLRGWQVEALRTIGTDRLYCAYDTPDDLEPLREAGDLLRVFGFTREHHLYCYVLVGYPKDTLDAAERRCRQAWDAGFMPMAMLWNHRHDIEWRRLQRTFARPALTRSILEAA